MEIRPHSGNEYRVFYVARFEEAVYVLHCFVKKTRPAKPTSIWPGNVTWCCLQRGDPNKFRRRL